MAKKKAQHLEWRKKNPISGPDEPILSCDMYLADQKVFKDDEEARVEALVAGMFGISMTTISLVC